MLHVGTLGSIVDLARGETCYRDRLEAEIQRRSALLSSRGVGRGARVAIAHGGSAAFFADLLAVWRLGACAAALNPAAPSGELENVISFLDPACVLVADGSRESMRVSVPALDLTTGAAAAASPETGAGDAEDPALMLFTSGTTGAPKAVVHTFGSVTARLALNREHIGDGILERTLCPLPTHFGHGLIGNALTPLLAGHRLVLPEGGLHTATTLGATVDEHGITFLSSVPALWKLALKLSRPPMRGSLQQVCVGSAPLSAELWSRIMSWSGTRRVVNMYGITEAANWIAGAPADELEPADGLIGRPWGGTLAVRDAGGCPQAHGEGELLVRSPALMKGYFQREDLTAAVLEDGWYRTGDVGTIDEDGIARLTGRIRNEINRAGMKVHPEDIDLLLERHPAVAEACAFGVPDEVSGEEVAVAICAAAEMQPTSDDLRAWCAERIRAEAVPHRYFFVPEIPKNERGKTNREEVRAHCLGGSA